MISIFTALIIKVQLNYYHKLSNKILIIFHFFLKNFIRISRSLTNN